MRRKRTNRRFVYIEDHCDLGNHCTTNAIGIMLGIGWRKALEAQPGRGFRKLSSTLGTLNRLDHNKWWVYVLEYPMRRNQVADLLKGSSHPVGTHSYRHVAAVSKGKIYDLRDTGMGIVTMVYAHDDDRVLVRDRLDAHSADFGSLPA